MGRRGRSGGITGKVLRAAERALTEREAEAHRLAQAVYVNAVEWEKADGPLPLAAVATSAQIAAPGTVQRLGLTAEDPELLAADVAAYLTAAWTEVLITTTAEDFRRWQERVDALEG